MLRLAIVPAVLALALALQGAEARAAPLGGLVPVAPLASFDATGSAGGFELFFDVFGGTADLQSLSDTPEIGGLGTISISLAWSEAAPTGTVSGFFEVMGGAAGGLIGTATGHAGARTGEIEVLFDTGAAQVVATYDFLDPAIATAADPFAALSDAGPFSLHDATITLTEVAPIPLPATLPLLIAGAGALLAARRRRA